MGSQSPPHLPLSRVQTQAQGTRIPSPFYSDRVQLDHLQPISTNTKL